MEDVAGAERFVGIDVAKAELVVHVRPTAEHFVVANDKAGLADLVTNLKPLTPALIVLGASGGYETLAAAHPAATALAVAVVSPRQTCRFAGVVGRLAKTDTLDAALSAPFAAAIRPAARALPDDLTAEVTELLARRCQQQQHRHPGEPEQRDQPGRGGGRQGPRVAPEGDPGRPRTRARAAELAPLHHPLCTPAVPRSTAGRIGRGGRSRNRPFRVTPDGGDALR